MVRVKIELLVYYLYCEQGHLKQQVKQIKIMKLEAYTAVSCEKQALDKTKISHRVADRIKNRCLFRYERVRTCKTTIQFCFFSVFFHPSL